MAGILEKTIESLNSLLSPVTASLGLSTKSMFERCLSARTKGEEAWCFQNALQTIQAHLSEPGARPSTVKKALGFVVFAELMGYQADFAYIHAVKLAQQGSLSEKKIGYMVCVQLLKDSHPLSMLLVNTILKDLASRNMVTIAMALAATCYLIPADQASAVLPMVVDKLTHSNEYIRGKAVVVLHHFLHVNSSQAGYYFHRVHPLLGDSDPGVVALVLQYLLDTSQNHPELMADLYQSVVSIQEQILNNRLPKDFLHCGISAPWTQLTILRLLRQLKPPLLDVQSVLHDTYKAVTGAESITNGSSILGAAIAVECLLTILELSPVPCEFTATIMSTVGHLLANHNTNLRYEGLNLLQALVTHQRINLTRDQQTVILRCLQHPDNAIKLKSLHLLCRIADSNSAESICDQVIDFLKSHCTNEHLQKELISLGISLADKYPSCGNHWHFAALLRLLPMAREQSKPIQSKLKVALLAGSQNDLQKPSSAHRKVLSYLTKHSESKKAPTSILELYVWVLSIFHELLHEDHGVRSEAKTHIMALEKIVFLGEKVYLNQIHGTLEIIPEEIHNLMFGIVEAARHLVETHFESIPGLPVFLKNLISASMTRVFGDAALRCACRELLNMISVSAELCKVSQEQIRNQNEVCDFTLSFLDDFVCSDLEGSGVPYKALPVKSGTKAAIQLTLESERNQSDVDICSSALLAAPCSLGSSELSLAGTENANNRESVSSISSTDSKCWTFTSPSQDVPPTPVWTKEGRVKGDSPPDFDVSFQANTSNSSEEPKSSTSPEPTISISSWLQKSIDKDPLDELQKDFETSFGESQKSMQPS